MFYDEQKKRQKNKSADNQPLPYNDKDYTQDFIGMGNAAKGNPALQKQFNQTQRQKEHYMKNTNMQPLIQRAKAKGLHSEAAYYQNLEQQKQANPALYQLAQLKGTTAARENLPRTNLSYRPLKTDNSVAGGAQSTAASAQEPDYMHYVPDFEFLMDNTNDPAMVAQYEQDRQAKVNFLMNNDIQAMIDAETDPRRKAALQQLLEDKLYLLSHGDKTAESMYGRALAMVGDNTGRVSQAYDDAANQVQQYADAYQSWAEQQLAAARKSAQGDADRAAKELYERYYQQDLPELERQLARMGGASASGFSRQEALLAQQGLLSERNAIEVEQNRILAEAEAQARDLISQGQIQQAEQLLNLATAKAGAVAEQLVHDQNAVMEYAGMLNDNQMQREEWQHSDADREDQQAFTAEENEKARRLEKDLREMINSNERAMFELEAQLKKSQTQDELVNAVLKLAIQYGFSGDMWYLTQQIQNGNLTKLISGIQKNFTGQA